MNSDTESWFALIIVVLLFAGLGVMMALDDRQNHKQESPVPPLVQIYGARERIGNNSNLDNSGGHIDFVVKGRWGYHQVVFVDKGFDGTLDEAKICKKQGGGEVVVYFPGGTKQPWDDKTVYSQEEWNQRFLEVRKEASSPTSMPSR